MNRKMKMTCLLCLCFSSSLLACGSRPSSVLKNPYIDKYVDQMEPGSQLVQEGYNFSVEKTTNNTYIYKTFYPTTKQITMYHSYRDRALKIRSGMTKEWWDNGLKRFEGPYANGKKNGEWKYYAGKKSYLNSYGNYKNGEKDGQWTFLDSLGNKDSEVQFVDGIKHGPYTIYKQGKVSKQGTYVNGENQETKKAMDNKPHQKGSMIDEMPHMASCQNEDKEAQSQCSDKTMLMAIYKNIKYPAFAREVGIEGSAIIRFYIDKDGSMKDITVMRGLCDEIKAECERIMPFIPQWNPGLQKGEAVKVYFNLPIRFRLE